MGGGGIHHFIDINEIRQLGSSRDHNMMCKGTLK